MQASTSTPIAAGERLKSRFQMYQYIEKDAIRLYQPDAARIGGITEFRKAVSLAETHSVSFQPHNPNGAVCLAAHLHLATASTNFSILEQGRLNPNDCAGCDAPARTVRRVAAEPVAFLRAGPAGSRHYDERRVPQGTQRGHRDGRARLTPGSGMLKPGNVSAFRRGA